MKTKFYVVLLIIFISLNIGLGSWGLTESSEARYAEISREMVLSGDYLHPQLLGIEHYHKPPMTYYITAAGYKIFGINEFGARFFLSLALTLQILLIFKIAKLFFKDEKIAFASGLIYFSFPLALIAARNLTTDSYLTTFILWSIYFWLQLKQGNSVWYFYGFYFMLGLAFLTKGPVVILPVLVFIGCWKLMNRVKFQFSIHSVLGLLLFIGISASWFIAIIIDQPQLWNYFIEDQIVNRSMNAEQFHRSEPFWYYLAFAPALGMPWIVFLSIGYVKKYKLKLERVKEERILLYTIGTLLVLFSVFSSKLILYILPIYPFIALLGGYVLVRFPESHKNLYIKIYGVLFGILLLGLIVIGFLDTIAIDLRLAIPLIFLIVGSGFYFMEYSNLNTFFRLLYLGIFFSISLLLTYALFGAENPDKINSIKEVVQYLKDEKGEQLDKFVVYDYLLPSASFYLNEDIITVYNTNFNAKRETKFQRDTLYKSNYLEYNRPKDLDRFKNLLKNENNVLIYRKKTPLNDSLQYLLNNFKNVKEMGKWVIHY
ncbi:glycosyltransferase family 39 protein [Gillisia sp. M10.2A]|uniref:Glycosyltransferase family 39 protein n=1 Tax=Gillisia lutea TaxID=2909668 RepID=A0ABS9EE74_9FLAO|nr:glycosyltransferase family 39 protein [Gillisia lutea]MCF4101170.1 glycosyltransferase family 39 protein [Gillisia lutea]